VRIRCNGQLDVATFTGLFDLRADRVVARLDALHLPRLQSLDGPLDLAGEAVRIARVRQFDILDAPPILFEGLGMVTHRGQEKNGALDVARRALGCPFHLHHQNRVLVLVQAEGRGIALVELVAENQREGADALGLLRHCCAGAYVPGLNELTLEDVSFDVDGLRIRCASPSRRGAESSAAARGDADGAVPRCSIPWNRLTL
jgi:hypothetical protein